MGKEATNKDIEFRLEEIEETPDQSDLLGSLDLEQPASEQSRSQKGDVSLVTELELGEEEIELANSLALDDQLEDLPNLTSLQEESEAPAPVQSKFISEDELLLKDNSQEVDLASLIEDNQETPFNVDEHEHQGEMIETHSQALEDQLEIEASASSASEQDQSTRVVKLPQQEAQLAHENATETLVEIDEEISTSSKDRTDPELEGALQFEEEQESKDQQESEAELPEIPTPRSNPVHSVEEIKNPYVDYQYDQNELLRAQATIRQVRQERERLLKEIEMLKEEGRKKDGLHLGIMAQLDEAQIELSILKRKDKEGLRNSERKLILVEEKLVQAQAKIKNYEHELKNLGYKARIDVNQIKERERELEGQLELMSMDAQAQIKSRDQKILELKRKIDALEFNMENACIGEKQAREEKEKIEERLNKVMDSLRKSIEFVEDEQDGLTDKGDSFSKRLVSGYRK